MKHTSLRPQSLHIINILPSMAPLQDSKVKNKIISTTNFRSFKATIFNTLAFKLSLEINNNKKITAATKLSFLKVFYDICQIEKKEVNFEQYARRHRDGPKIAICETVSDPVFVLNSSFTTKDNFSEPL